MTSLLLLVWLSGAPWTQQDTTMAVFLPSSVIHWQKSGPAEHYAGRQIFDYMDGAGEIYLAYGFRDLLVQRYAGSGQEEILVEVFDMGSTESAFGVNTYMKGRGPGVRIGQEGEYRSGLLTFWRSRFFVCVRVEEERGDAKRGVLETGRAIAKAIGQDGPQPAILGLLPRGTSLPATLRYFTRHEILNAHFYLAETNLLRLDGRTEAVLVRMKSDRSVLLIVRYPDGGAAAAALGSFRAGYMPEAKEQGAVRTENGKWTVCSTKGAYVVVVFDTRTRRAGQEVVNTTLRRLP